MKTFELIENENGSALKVIEGEKIWWVSSQNSPRYQEYLRYTAWVEAGNTPEDFWTQSDELIEPSEPKEEEETTEGES